MLIKACEEHTNREANSLSPHYLRVWWKLRRRWWCGSSPQLFTSKMSGLPRDAWRQHHHNQNLPPGGGGISHHHEATSPPSMDRQSSDETVSSYDDASSLYSDEGESLPYPGFLAVTFGCLHQEAAPRSQCLALITNPYPLLQ